MSQPLDLSQISAKVYKEVKGEIFIGGEKIKPEVRNLLKEQAKYISTSQLFEIIIATTKHEAYDVALNQSKDWNHIEFAKALKYFSDVCEKMVIKLSQ